MFEPFEVIYGGVQLVLVVFGLVELLKDWFGLDGKKVTILSAFMGLVVYVPTQLVPYLPEVYAEVLNVVYPSLVFGLTASGYYKYVEKKFVHKPGE